MNDATKWTPRVGDKGKTRGGTDYEVLLIENRAARDCEVIVLIGREVETVAMNGQYFGEGRNDNRDLMPPKRVVFVNLYPYTSGSMQGAIRGEGYYYESEALARKNARDHAVAIAVPVELPA